jgi:hypothetical protein
LLKNAVKSDTNQTALKRRHLERMGRGGPFDRGTDALGSACGQQCDRAYQDARSPKVGERLGIEMSGNSTEVETM